VHNGLVKIIASAAIVLVLLACRAEISESVAIPEAEVAESAAVAETLTPGAGVPAPDFTLTSHQGADVTLSSSRGRNVILVFYRGYW
jgi:cytochrome oxidase Cu insertion factor (SCO1/SenC/PrrC family)